jgi:lipopolysaccharide export system protein LptA
LGCQEAFGWHTMPSKFRAFMKNTPTPLVTLAAPLVCLLSLLLLAAAPAQAEKADRDKPMNVAADSLKYDDLKQTSEFLGNVVLTKGTLVIRAQQVVVRQDPQGYQFGTALGSAGSKAFFRQKREKLDEWIEGEALSLLYDGRADTVRFTESAVIRRYKGATLTDESSGHSIVYDNTTDVFTIDGGKRPAQAAVGASSSTGGAGRIRAVLSPKMADSDAAGDKGAGVSLRSSGELSGSKK